MKLLTTGTLVASALCVFPGLAAANPLSGYFQTNLVSDIPGLAAVTDPDLKNPWGIAASATSPYWIANNATGVSTLYNGLGAKSALVVTIPGAGGSTGSPTGAVRNGVSTTFNGDNFIFGTEDGLIAGWRGALGATAEILIDKSATGAVYKGLAIASTGGFNYLYAANFNSGHIDVTGSAGAPALAGNFVNAAIPAGYAPFNIQNIGGKLYVTYAVQNAIKHDDVAGPGLGYVAVYDLNGNLLQTLVSAGGALNAPWGLAIAPAGFGLASHDLLVGNFGDGTINAFDVVTGAYLGTLASNATPLVNDDLWGLTFGNGNTGSDPKSLYLTAGLNDETDGLFGRISPVPEPATIALFGFGILGLGFISRKGKLA